MEMFSKNCFEPLRIEMEFGGTWTEIVQGGEINENYRTNTQEICILSTYSGYGNC